MSDLTDHAEQLLAGITPGPWDFNEWPDQTTIDNGEGVVVAALPSCLRTNSEADTRFIVAAPQLIADLLAEVKRLTPREITSVEELDALPIGSVIRTSSNTYERWTEDGLWHSHFGSVTSETLAEPWCCGLACIRVIYVPEVKS